MHDAQTLSLRPNSSSISFRFSEISTPVSRSGNHRPLTQLNTFSSQSRQDVGMYASLAMLVLLSDVNETNMHVS